LEGDDSVAATDDAHQGALLLMPFWVLLPCGQGMDLRELMQIALARCHLQLDDGSFSNSHRPSSEGTFRVDAPE
jgi:hypothetical protein